jgi:hypothetical protein
MSAVSTDTFHISQSITIISLFLLVEAQYHKAQNFQCGEATNTMGENKDN